MNNKRKFTSVDDKKKQMQNDNSVNHDQILKSIMLMLKLILTKTNLFFNFIITEEQVIAIKNSIIDNKVKSLFQQLIPTKKNSNFVNTLPPQINLKSKLECFTLPNNIMNPKTNTNANTKILDRLILTFVPLFTIDKVIEWIKHLDDKYGIDGKKVFYTFFTDNGHTEYLNGGGACILP
jgi:hypothetical protein